MNINRSNIYIYYMLHVYVKSYHDCDFTEVTELYVFTVV